MRNCFKNHGSSYLYSDSINYKPKFSYISYISQNGHFESENDEIIHHAACAVCAAWWNSKPMLLFATNSAGSDVQGKAFCQPS